MSMKWTMSAAAAARVLHQVTADRHVVPQVTTALKLEGFQGGAHDMRNLLMELHKLASNGDLKALAVLYGVATELTRTVAQTNTAVNRLLGGLEQLREMNTET